MAAVRVAVAVKVRWGMASCLSVVDAGVVEDHDARAARTPGQGLA